MKKYDYETEPERMLRVELESRGLKKEVDFLTQHPTRAGFVLDFLFPKHNLIVEVDGLHWHKPGNRRDRFRDYLHKRAGMKTMRFTDKEIYANVKKCVDKILVEVEIEHEE